MIINSLGCDNDRAAYKKELYNFLKDRLDDLCEDCRRRTDTNVLRVLDCKRPACKQMVSDAPGILDYLCDSCSRDYSSLKNILSDRNVNFMEKKELVRGLDYYSGAIFEVTHSDLGAQDALAAGGRYDGLTSQMGGPERCATGFAIGVERLMLILDRKQLCSSQDSLLIIPMDEDLMDKAFTIMCELRVKGIAVEMDFSGKSFKRQMIKAGKSGKSL